MGGEGRQVALVESHIARAQFQLGLTLKPWLPLTRSFVALDHAVSLVLAQVCLYLVRACVRACMRACMCVCVCGSACVRACVWEWG
jgi:hypothetical protein